MLSAVPQFIKGCFLDVMNLQVFAWILWLTAVISPLTGGITSSCVFPKKYFYANNREYCESPMMLQWYVIKLQRTFVIHLLLLVLNSQWKSVYKHLQLALQYRSSMTYFNKTLKYSSPRAIIMRCKSWKEAIAIKDPSLWKYPTVHYDTNSM